MDITQTNNTTPKEKAAWLVLKYMSKVVNMQTAKECALVTVDEIIDVVFYAPACCMYWEEVKYELEKL